MKHFRLNVSFQIILQIGKNYPRAMVKEFNRFLESFEELLRADPGPGVDRQLHLRDLLVNLLNIKHCTVCLSLFYEASLDDSSLFYLSL